MYLIRKISLSLCLLLISSFVMANPYVNEHLLYQKCLDALTSKTLAEEDIDTTLQVINDKALWYRQDPKAFMDKLHQEIKKRVDFNKAHLTNTLDSEILWSGVGLTILGILGIPVIFLLYKKIYKPRKEQFAQIRTQLNRDYNVTIAQSINSKYVLPFYNRPLNHIEHLRVGEHVAELEKCQSRVSGTVLAQSYLGPMSLASLGIGIAALCSCTKPTYKEDYQRYSLLSEKLEDYITYRLRTVSLTEQV